MDFRERINDHQEGLRAVLDGRQAQTWTSLPGIITAVDLVKHTVSVQPSIQSVVLSPEGKRTNTTLPLLVDVPIVWARGGDYTTTFPVKVDDEVLVVFSARCIDNWWESGGVQPQFEQRMHDLSDGFAIPGPFSQKTKIDAVSANTAQMRSNDGTLYTEIDLPNKAVRLRAGSLLVELDSTNGKVTISAPTEVVVNCPTVTINGNLNVTGAVVAGSGTGDQVSVQSHRHTLVSTGTAQSGPPQPGS